MSAKASRTPSAQHAEASDRARPGAPVRQDALGAIDGADRGLCRADRDLLAGTGEARPTDIARRLGVSHATAIKMIARLKREGVATARPYRGVFLTESGHELAARVSARHRLVVDVLIALGVPAEAAEADAEGIEHHVSDATLKAFARFLQGAKPG